MMQYRGSIGVAEVYVDSATIDGHVVGLRGGITFPGLTVEEAIQSFQDSGDCYLDWCERDGVKPGAPHRGYVSTRVDPRLHRWLDEMARSRGIEVGDLVRHLPMNAMLGLAPTGADRGRLS